MRGDGPIPSRVMVVGSFPDYDDLSKGLPYSRSHATKILDTMLHEAGITRSECYVTYACHTPPPGGNFTNLIPLKKGDIKPTHKPLLDRMVAPVVLENYARLLAEIKMVKPNVIIAFGDLATWVLTGKWGIMRWRGSMLKTLAGEKVIPTWPPETILQQWSLRALALSDIKRAARFRAGADYPIPQYKMIIRPPFNLAIETFQRILAQLEAGPTYLSFDIETSRGHIDCAGIAWSPAEAICIPFFEVLNSRISWFEEEELILVNWFRILLTHPNALVIGQNIIYDSQYTYRHWCFVPRVAQDTMISFHCAFAGLRKSLDFQASLLCDYYVQWKPDKSQYKEGG